MEEGDIFTEDDEYNDAMYASVEAYLGWTWSAQLAQRLGFRTTQILKYLVPCSSCRLILFIYVVIIK